MISAHSGLLVARFFFFISELSNIYYSSLAHLLDFMELIQMGIVQVGYFKNLVVFTTVWVDSLGEGVAN